MWSGLKAEMCVLGSMIVREIENQIKTIKAAAVCFGNGNDNLRWLEMHKNAFLDQFNKRGCRIIPVLLEHAPREKPESPLFNFGWVDFHEKDPDPIEQLIWGIRG